MTAASTTQGARRAESSFVRVARYTGVRLIAVLVTVVVGVYLTILIANMGGYVDEIRMGQIREAVGLMAGANPDLPFMSDEERIAYVEQLVAIEVERLGMDRPFLLRSFTYLANALTLNFGRAEQLISDSGSRLVRLIIIERLPSTLYLFATGQLLLFGSAILLALYLSQRYGSWLDRLVVALAPTSAAPGWFYGIFLILIFAGILRLLPFGGMVDTPPPADRLQYALSLLKHLILPISAILMGALWQTTYFWRTFFLIYSREDYVEMARAKGLPPHLVERRYILRPTLPAIVTSFALQLISMWMGAIVLETVFRWPGIGQLFFRAIGSYDTPVLLGIVVTYAYLLAVTVLVLEIVYAILDPRVRIEGRKAEA